MKVLIIGGGVGGLCLAHSLLRAGVPVEVHERDTTPEGRRQGYRLRISPEGEQGLRACLPQELQDLLVATANRREHGGLAAYDERLEPQWAPTVPDSRGEAPDRIDAVDRVTLRRILLTGLERVVRFGRDCRDVEFLPDGRVRAHFAQGDPAEGDLLVAADGAGSRIRARLRPQDRPKDLGVRTVFSRIPRAAAHSAGLPEVLRDRFSYVIGSDGHHLGLMPMVFREAPTAAARRLAPAARLTDPEDYYMAVFNVHRGDLALPDEEFFALSGKQLNALVTQRTAGWHPALRGVFDHADTEQSFAVALRATVPVEPWEPGPVVPLGDAAHTMPPSGGVGANTALRDAAGLGRALSEAAAGREDLAAALASYQQAMAEYAEEGVQLSLRIAKWSIPATEVPA
ncbi:2-polyprenyl-6-methoxyphenol hydroxylase-like FAD-dependent oxidoreductase [Streptomyces sp. V3I8]|jgi:2-polyprenyl-6-methoxyphenol hydroxylase-like FAD-dependent oxidoreductase|uniref:FAD-dependent oxidoreductase n=1 Tax=Streptomyces sp. V3I8 TaxID=3042279 RepID=UPI00277D1F80|nr:FAD-dependent monooxygenase [Streptomyces sp. V3I8]MDQ1041667.1 2-polyprenyl-6-methoxyphenol hydroxylase-like FAD-dependent oxidoreductase [Streptomyces sp. V3I8]